MTAIRTPRRYGPFRRAVNVPAMAGTRPGRVACGSAAGARPPARAPQRRIRLREPTRREGRWEPGELWLPCESWRLVRPGVRRALTPERLVAGPGAARRAVPPAGPGRHPAAGGHAVPPAPGPGPRGRGEGGTAPAPPAAPGRTAAARPAAAWRPACAGRRTRC